MLRVFYNTNTHIFGLCKFFKGVLLLRVCVLLILLLRQNPLECIIKIPSALYSRRATAKSVK